MNCPNCNKTWVAEILWGLPDNMEEIEKRELDSIDMLSKTFGKFLGMRKDMNGKKITADLKTTIRKILRKYKKKSRQAYRGYLITLNGLKCEA